MNKDFQMDYGRVPNKARCAVVSGTILASKSLGHVFISCANPDLLERTFKKLAPKGCAFDAALVQDVVIFTNDVTLHGDEARSLPPESPWEQMDTAPKDGREIIIQVEQRAGIPHKSLVGHYMAGGHCIEGHPPIEEGWYFWNGVMFDRASKPQRWMPLPE